jgi:hypothetical protein
MNGLVKILSESKVVIEERCSYDQVLDTLYAPSKNKNHVDVRFRGTEAQFKEFKAKIARLAKAGQ